MQHSRPLAVDSEAVPRTPRTNSFPTTSARSNGRPWPTLRLASARTNPSPALKPKAYPPAGAITQWFRSGLRCSLGAAQARPQSMVAMASASKCLKCLLQALREGPNFSLIRSANWGPRAGQCSHFTGRGSLSVNSRRRWEVDAMSIREALIAVVALVMMAPADARRWRQPRS